jgi:hypothetical protein
MTPSEVWKISDGFYVTRYVMELADEGYIYKVGAYLERRYGATWSFHYERNAIDHFEAIKVAMAGMILDLGDRIEAEATYANLLEHMPDRELRDVEGYLKVFPSVEHVDDAVTAKKQRDANPGVEELDEHG